MLKVSPATFLNSQYLGILTIPRMWCLPKFSQCKSYLNMQAHLFITNGEKNGDQASGREESKP